MENKNRKNNKYVWAINTIQILLAIIFILCALRAKTTTYIDVWLGIATGLIGNVIIFFIMRYFMENNDSEAIDKIDEILKKKTQSDEELHRRIENMISAKMTELNYSTDEKESLHQFFKRIDLEKTDEIYMIGYSLAHVFEQHRKDFIKYLQKNVKIKVILISPESTAGKLMAERVGRLHRVGEPHRRTLTYIEEINEEANNESCQIEVAKVSWVPSCTVILTKNDNASFYVMLLGLNGFSLNNKIRGVDRRLYSVCTSTFEDERISFIKNNYEYLWNDHATEKYTDIKGYLDKYE